MTLWRCQQRTLALSGNLVLTANSRSPRGEWENVSWSETRFINQSPVILYRDRGEPVSPRVTDRFRIYDYRDLW